MEIISPDDFPPLGYDETKRIALLHQSKLRDIRLRVHGIDPNNFEINELKKFLKFCIDITD